MTIDHKSWSQWFTTDLIINSYAAIPFFTGALVYVIKLEFLYFWISTASILFTVAEYFKNCTGDFVLGNQGDICYKIIDGNQEKKNWSDAMNYCRLNNSTLFIVDSDQKLSSYKEVIPSFGKYIIMRWVGSFSLCYLCSVACIRRTEKRVY